MRGWKGFALGFMGLTLLELTVSRPAANQATAGLLAGPGNFARRFLSPGVPALGPAPQPVQGVSGTASQGAVAGAQAAMGNTGGYQGGLFGVYGTASQGATAGANAAMSQLGGKP